MSQISVLLPLGNQRLLFYIEMVQNVSIYSTYLQSAFIQDKMIALDGPTLSLVEMFHQHTHTPLHLESFPVCVLPHHGSSSLISDQTLDKQDDEKLGIGSACGVLDTLYGHIPNYLRIESDCETPEATARCRHCAIVVDMLTA